MPFLSPSALASAWPSVMPMSSTVWWASISRSPWARTVRSMAPWRATWSSMWSRNGMPDANSALPVPSRSSATKTWVSFVSRWMSALRMGGIEDRGEGPEESGVLVGCADGEPQAMGELGVGTVQVLDRYTTRFQCLEHARRAAFAGCLHAHQHEVGGAR